MFFQCSRGWWGVPNPGTHSTGRLKLLDLWCYTSWVPRRRNQKREIKAAASNEKTVFCITSSHSTRENAHWKWYKDSWNLGVFMLFHFNLVIPICPNFLRFCPYSLKPQSRHVPGVCLWNDALWINRHTIFMNTEEIERFLSVSSGSHLLFTDFGITSDQRQERPLQSTGTLFFYPQLC